MLTRIRNFGLYCFHLTQGKAVLALVFLLLGSLTEGISILLLIPLLHLVGPAQGGAQASMPILSDLLGPGVRLELVPLLLIFVVLVTAQAAFNRFKTIYMADMMQLAVDRMRMRLFAAIGMARWRLIARTRGSDLNHALTADIDRVQGAIFNLLQLVQNVILLVTYALVAALVSIQMALFAAAVGGVALAMLYPVRRRSARFGETLTLSRQEQYRTISEFISGVKMAKSFNAEPAYLKQLSHTLKDVRAQAVGYTRLSSLGTLLFQVTSTFAIAAFIYVAFVVVHMPLARIAVMALVFMRVAPRFNAVQDSVQQLLVNIPAFDAMRALMIRCEQEREGVQGTQGRALPPLSDAIRFENVTLRFNDDALGEVLKAASFMIPAGRITAMIGPSGSGKSTIADLVMGLLEPSEGSVTVDGTALGAENRRSWRDQIAYVPQEVFLLHDTIATNLAVARPWATESEMWEALDAAGAGGFARLLPDRLQTVVGDRGIRLSGGERQRIALARGLLRHPTLLILDEATSALDWENQRLIARSIEQLRGTMTIITIAHRPSMIAFADWVVAIEDGRIIETGDYATLLDTAESRLRRLVIGEQGSGADTYASDNRMAD